jgi:uncharacterized Zn finger protein (UPF0148 family)
MPGLLNKIRTEHASPAFKREPAKTATRLDDGVVDRGDGTPTEPAEPCPVCRCPIWWRSAYGGELRCAVCDEWPSLAMVGERWTLCQVATGRYAWTVAPKRGERPDAHSVAVSEPQSQPDADSASWSVGTLKDDEGEWIVFTKTKARGVK